MNAILPAGRLYIFPRGPTGHRSAVARIIHFVSQLRGGKLKGESISSQILCRERENKLSSGFICSDELQQVF